FVEGGAGRRGGGGPVGGGRLVLFLGDAGVGLDDGLIAFDVDDDGLELAGGLGLAGPGGVAIKSQVGGEAVAKEAEEGVVAGAVAAFGGEADAQKGERVFQRVGGALHDVVLGADDLEQLGLAGG